MDANSEFAVTALSEGSRVPSILFGVCSTLPYPTVDIGHIGFCCWRYKDANLEFAVHCLIQGLHLAYDWAGWTGVNAARAEEHQRSKGVLVFLESCCDWGSCCLVWRRFALPFTPSLLSFQKDCFVIPFFNFFLGASDCSRAPGGSPAVWVGFGWVFLVQEHHISTGVLVFWESCWDWVWGSCWLVRRWFALTFTPSLFGFSKDFFVSPF